MNVIQSEPVMVASGATVIAGGVVALGEVTHLYAMSDVQATLIIGAVFTVASIVSSWWARRKVTPTVKATPPAAPPAA